MASHLLCVGEMSEEIEQTHRQRNKVLLIALIVFALAGLGWFGYWIFYGRFYVTTEDAYVHGNQVMLTPQVSSGVKVIYAEETDLVEKGQLVVDLDPSDYILNLEQSEENLAEQVRVVSGYFLDVEKYGALWKEAVANLYQAKLDMQNREGLAQTGAISKEQWEQYQTNVLTNEAIVESAKKRLEVAIVRVEGTTVQTHPLVKESVVLVKQAYLDLVRCRVLAPMSGYVAKRSVQVGDFVHSGDTLLEIVPLDYLWAEANYKETKLGKVRVGQPVTFTSDLHGHSVKYKGHVIGFQAGSGSAFALLPAQNASGNWIKIVQRIPVRVSISSEQIRKNPLFIGGSLDMKVDVSDTSGSMLTFNPTMKPIYSTEIFDTQFEQMESYTPVIEKIIADNRGY